MQANHTLNDVTLGIQMLEVGAAFLETDVALAKTPVSSGSTTVTPTNDDISIVYSDTMAYASPASLNVGLKNQRRLLSTSLSGIYAILAGA